MTQIIQPTDKSKPCASTQFNNQFQQVGLNQMRQFKPIGFTQKYQPTEQPLQAKFSQQCGLIKFNKQLQSIDFTQQSKPLEINQQSHLIGLTQHQLIELSQQSRQFESTVSNQLQQSHDQSTMLSKQSQYSQSIRPSPDKQCEPAGLNPELLELTTRLNQHSEQTQPTEFTKQSQPTGVTLQSNPADLNQDLKPTGFNQKSPASRFYWHSQPSELNQQSHSARFDQMSDLSQQFCLNQDLIVDQNPQPFEKGGQVVLNGGGPKFVHCSVDSAAVATRR